jgi:hypothetical protein
MLLSLARICAAGFWRSGRHHLSRAPPLRSTTEEIRHALENQLMSRIDHIVIQLLDAIESLMRIILAGLAAAEIWVRTQLGYFGVPPGISVVILIAIALLLIVAALRLLGPIVYIVVMVFMVLLMLHALMPITVQH